MSGAQQPVRSTPLVSREYNAAMKRPCGTCKWFNAGYCSSIQDYVKSWWTGCIRHSPNAPASATPNPEDSHES